jgi:cyclophilin family peptidyl-prolyl cis-trans isomerase
MAKRKKKSANKMTRRQRQDSNKTPKRKYGLFSVIAVVLIVVIIAAGVIIAIDPFAPEEQKEEVARRVILETNFGEIEIKLFGDKAPRTVENFLTLAGEGFYDGTRFHRVIADFMIQGGCPYSADEGLKDRWGTGGPEYVFDCEIHAENFNVRGTIAMANAGRNTNGSQFFINVVDNARLNAGHTVFGRVVSGMDVVDRISAVETGPRDVPLEEVVLKRVVVQ